MSSRFTFAVGFVIAASAVACSSFSGSVDVSTNASTSTGSTPPVQPFNGVSDPPEVGDDDDPATDSGATTDGGGTGGDGGLTPDSGAMASNLLTNGDFETGDSTGWAKNSATIVPTSLARSGSFAARVCTNTGGSSIFATLQIGGAAAGTKYDFDVWFHATDSGNAGTAVQCNLEMFSKGGMSLGLEYTDGSISTTWESCHVSFTLVSAPAAGTTLRAGIVEGASGCVLADDAVVTKQ